MKFCEPYILSECSIYIELIIINKSFHIGRGLFCKFNMFQNCNTYNCSFFKKRSLTPISTGAVLHERWFFLENLKEKLNTQGRRMSP